MARSSSEKKPCTQCDKGYSIMTCHGCRQPFCMKHLVNHRQDLRMQMDHIGQEYDCLRHDLDECKTADMNSLLKKIDTWELQSIAKIQAEAETTRLMLQQEIHRNRNQLNIKMNIINQDLCSRRDSDDYTEIELQNWMEQIKELRQLIEKPIDIDIIHEDRISKVVGLLKIRNNSAEQLSNSLQESLQTLHSYKPEVFDETIGAITLSEINLFATCSNSNHRYCIALGKTFYFEGMHRIRFRTDNITVTSPFFGIVSSTQLATSPCTLLMSTHGWWAQQLFNTNDNEECTSEDHTIKVGDEFTLVINCDTNYLVLLHHRTGRLRRQDIDVYGCLPPWKILVALSYKNESVRILH